MRLFIAIELPAEVREHLHRMQQALGPHLGSSVMTRDAALHITVKFLGEVDPPKVDKIIESLAAVTGGAVELTATHAECFPERGPVRIIAAGLERDVAGLKGIHDAIDQRCVRLGFRREERPYKGHVTLVRARPALAPHTRRLVTDITAPLWPGPTFTAGSFVLFQSQLTPQGSQYTKLHEFALHA